TQRARAQGALRPRRSRRHRDEALHRTDPARCAGEDRRDAGRTLSARSATIVHVPRTLDPMIRIVRLGSPRAADEGLRIGTVRRPPRGVPKSEYAARDLYDVWLPTLAPSEPLVKQ